jgi:hypothetical protein
MENKKSVGEGISSANAVLLGALAPGVNVRTISQPLISLMYVCVYIYIYILCCYHSDACLIGSQGPTWNTLKSTFVMLGLCLALMLGLAFSASDSSLILHVAFLVLITVTLFLLLSWYLNFSAKNPRAFCFLWTLWSYSKWVFVGGF